MKVKNIITIGALLLAVITSAYGVQTIPASNSCFTYEGRIDFNDPNLPVIIWQASRISIDFEGDTLNLLFEKPSWQTYFDANIDGKTTIVDVNMGVLPKDEKFSGLGKGRHNLVLSKRNEASSGYVTFKGIQIDDGGGVYKSEPVKYKLRMEFYGDSKTAAACNEDGNDDQWETRRTHNGLLSYAAMTAEAFGADHRNIAVSGMGIITGYVDVNAEQMWNKYYPKESSATADLKTWAPDVVFINIGENDDSFTKKQNQAFPPNFVEKYVSYVKGIRGAYPKAHIVLLRGGMWGGMHSEPLNKAYDEIVNQIETSDKNLSHYVFKYQAKNHPRVAEDRKLADELIEWLKQQDFMKAYK